MRLSDDGGVTHAHREQPWRDDETERGRVVLLSANPISAAIETIASTVGHEVIVIAEDDGGPGLAASGCAPVTRWCCATTTRPTRRATLRDALASDASYVAMMASRHRAEGLLADLGAEGVPGLDKLHVPAGHNLGGKGPGEIALSVVAEIVAESYGRPGGPMRAIS